MSQSHVQSKVEELNRKYNPDFAKTQKTTKRANGFMSQKGRIHFSLEILKLQARS